MIRSCTKALLILIALILPAAADTYTFALASPDIFGSLSFVSGNPNYNLQITINAGSDIPGPEIDALYGVAFTITNQALTVSTDSVYSISGVNEANISGQTETPTGHTDSQLPALTHWGFNPVTGSGGTTAMTWMIVGGQKQNLIIGAPASGNTYTNLSGNSFDKHNPFYLTTGAIVFDVQVPNLLSTDKIAATGQLQFGTAGTTVYTVFYTDTVPEPDPPILIGSGVLLILIGAYRKRRKSPAKLG